MAEKTTWGKIKVKIIGFLDRRKHTVSENLRLCGVVSLILILVGIFLPLVTVNTGIGFVNEAKSEAEIPLVQPNESLVQISAGDLLSHKQLKDFKIFGTKIEDMELLGINVYGLVTTPLPSFEKLNSVNSFLKSGTLNFLTDENFVKFCHENLGDFGDSIVELGSIIVSIADQASPVINEITVIMNKINEASGELRTAIAQVETYIGVIENIVIILFILILVGVVWYMVGRGPRFLPAILLTILSVIFLAIGIGVLIGNSTISGALASASQELNSSIYALIDGIVPGGTLILSQIFSIDQMKFVFHLDLVCGAGWWLITGGLISATVLAYVAPVFKKKEQAKIVAKEQRKLNNAK